MHAHFVGEHLTKSTYCSLFDLKFVPKHEHIFEASVLLQKGHTWEKASLNTYFKTTSYSFFKSDYIAARVN